MSTDKINIEAKLLEITEYWQPHIISQVNGHLVKLAKLKGEFVWHHHEKEDELFMVIKGQLKIELRDKIVELAEGEMYLVPKGVEHKPVAESEVHILLFEPGTTLNTGNVNNERTIENLKSI